MEKTRSISKSKARAKLGALLRTLASDGPIEITRNGRVIGILSPHREDPQASNMAQLPAVARSYAAGDSSWRQVEEETGAAFGELLVELGRQGLQLPRATAEKSEAQRALLKDALAQNAPVNPPSS